MRIRYAVSSMIFWWRENHLSFEQECQFLKSLGFGIELWPHIKGQDECRYDRRNWPRLQAATEGMLVSMRTSCSGNGGLKLEKWAEQIECAKLLNASIVADLRSVGAGSDSNGTGITEQVVELAHDSNVRLSVETGDLDKIKNLGERFDSLRYCLDTGYANMDRRHCLRDYVDQLAPKVAHLHLTDNYGQIDDHEPPGLRGGIARHDWQYLLEQLQRYDNDVIGSLEMCPCMPAVMIRQATEFLFDDLAWPNPPKKQPDQTYASYNPV